MEISEVRKNLSASEIFISIIAVIGLNIIAVLLAGFRENKLFFEVLYTARLTMLLFNIAFCIFILPGNSQSKIKFWYLIWIGSFIAYAVHVYYSFFLFFNGSFAEFYGAQGVFVATLNLVITFWWLFDVFLIVFFNSNKKWVTIQRYGIHGLLFLAFFVSTVILHAVDNKELFVIIMGIALGVSAMVCLTIRLAAKKSKAS